MRSKTGLLALTSLVSFVSVLPAVDLEEITVTGTRTEKRLADSPVVTEIIGRDELEALGATDLTTALAAYGLVVDGDRSHGDQVRLQGLGGNRLLVLVDGRRVLGRVATNLDGRTVPLDNVERIEVVRGPQSALYGSDAMGGVINIITRRPRSEASISVENTSVPAYDNPDNTLAPSPEGGLWFQSQRVEALVGTRWTGGEAGVSATASRSEAYFEELGEVSILPRSGLVKASARASWDGLGGQWTLETGGTTLFEEDQTSFTGSLDRREMLRAEVSGGWSGPWAGGALRWSAGDQVYRRSTSSYSGGLDTWGEESVQQENAASAEAWYTRDLSDILILTLGTDASWNLVWDPDLTKEALSVDRQAVVAQLEAFQEGVSSVVAGLRVERGASGWFAAPKVSAMAVVAPGWRLLGGLGLGYRSPSVEDLYYDIDWSWHPIVRGNPELVPEVSAAANLGLEWSQPQGASARINAFHQELFDEIVSVEQGVAADGRTIYINENRDRTLRSGLDTEASLPWGPLTLEGGGGWVFAWDRGAGQELEGVGGLSLRGALRFALESWGLTARLAARWSDLNDLVVVDAGVTKAWSPHWESSLRASNLTNALDPEHGPFTPVSVTLGLKARI